MNESFTIRFREKSVGRIEKGLGLSFIIFPFLFFSCLKNANEFVCVAFVVLSVLGCFSAVFVRTIWQATQNLSEKHLKL